MLYFRSMLALVNVRLLHNLAAGFLLVAVSNVSLAYGQASAAQDKTSRYMESIRNQPLLLEAFLRRMPKGGDLHNHLPGAIYAESFIHYAVENGMCVDRASSALLPPPCDDGKGKPEARVAYQEPLLYNQMLDALSMRQFLPGRESGHDHFFATFPKFMPAMSGHTAEMLVEVTSRSAANHLQYLELIFNPDGGQAGALGLKVPWSNDFGKMRQQLLEAGLPGLVAQASRVLDQAEVTKNESLHCGRPQADPGCNVEVRYIYEVARGLPREMVFAQILAGFEMASRDSRVVGLNLVMPEDWYVPIHDFNLHMEILDYLHKVYPKVHISLHAGELTAQLAPPEELFHIRASIDRGHAERIGHGIDVMQERDPSGLLRQMASQHVLVEICLTSNDVILGVTGMRHPLPVYLRYGVPVALATDDAGVSRSDITHEYLRAVETYHLTYSDLKKMARASIAYSFLSAGDKAKVQAQMEAAFTEFERGFSSPSD
jgi:adenosine deaminase